MAKVIYVCYKHKPPAQVEDKLFRICKKLAPDNINSTTPMVVRKGNIAYGIMNPPSSLHRQGNSLFLGHLIDKNDKWAEPLKEYPEGTYALFRDGEEHLEVASDFIASRTVWYYMDKHVFVSSTSQRAIIMFIGNFAFNEKIIPWMLSTGSLGPSFSWDKRIERIPPNSSVILSKKKWTISKNINHVKFNIQDKPRKEHNKSLKESIKTTFELLNLDYSKWALPLSGGYDSRGILCFLHDVGKNIKNLKTITWGLESSQNKRKNDAYIAKKLAEKVNVSHRYYHTNISTEPIDTVIQRFLLCGEGRIDNISGYMDGFSIWKTLFENGLEGIIRGDEVFGWLKATSSLEVRMRTGCNTCSDYSNLENYLDYGFSKQELPQYLFKKDGESLNNWFDRIDQEYRIPIFNASLTDLKLSYVELINPLLNKSILEQVRQLPEDLREDKILWKKIVNSVSPKIGYAKYNAIDTADNILAQKQLVELIKGELSSENAVKIFPETFLDFVLKDIKAVPMTKQKKISIHGFGKKILPDYLKKMIKKIYAKTNNAKLTLPRLDPNKLAFRTYIICRMHTILNNDCISEREQKASAYIMDYNTMNFKEKID